MWNPPDPNYFATVWRIVRQIPEGKVSSYGQIASMIPPMPEADADQYRRLGPRWVGTAMRTEPDAPIPWHRVINSQGSISLAGTTGTEQRQRLEAEGVTFDAKGRVDFEQVGWDGPDDDWLDENDLLPPNTLGGKPHQPSLL